jgi:hypothetical protein
MRRLLLAAVVTALGAGCAAPAFDASARYTRLSLDGDVGIQNEDVTAQNSVEDLGLDDDEGAAGARVDVKWGAPHLSLSYERTSFSGRGRTNAEISEGGVVIPVDTDVESDLDLDVVAAALTFDFLPTENFELGLGVGVTGFGFDAKVSEIGGTQVEVDEQEFLPLPVVALRGGLQFGRFSASALLSGMQVTYDGGDYEYLDLDLQARMTVFEVGHVVLGWREIRADAEYEDDDTDVDLDLDLSGPYIGLGFGF